jgi:pilus assembly protein CpaF
LLNELDPHQDRIVVIEESAEMQIEAENVVRLECRTTPGLPPVTIRDLVKIALRHRPDHLIVGEVRDAAAMDLLDALNTGNSGSMTTIHANSSLAALTKLSNLALRASADIPHAAIQAQIADVITYVVQMERRGDTRRVSEVIRLNRYDFNGRLFVSDPVYPKPTVTKGTAN